MITHPPTQRGMSNLTQHLIEFRMNVTLLTHRGKRLDSLNEISKSNPPPNPDSVDGLEILTYTGRPAAATGVKKAHKRTATHQSLSLSLGHRARAPCYDSRGHNACSTSSMARNREGRFLLLNGMSNFGQATMNSVNLGRFSLQSSE